MLKNLHYHHKYANRHCFKYTRDINFTQHTGIPIATLCAEGYGYTLFGLEVWGVSIHLSITQYCKEQRQMVRLTHTLSLCLSVRPSQSHHQHYQWNTGKDNCFFYSFKKKPEEQTAANVTLGFLRKTKALRFKMVSYAKPGNAKKSECRKIAKLYGQHIKGDNLNVVLLLNT